VTPRRTRLARKARRFYAALWRFLLSPSAF
jgi:hypothetical protein